MTSNFSIDLTKDLPDAVGIAISAVDDKYDSVIKKVRLVIMIVSAVLIGWYGLYLMMIILLIKAPPAQIIFVACVLSTVLAFLNEDVVINMVKKVTEDSGPWEVILTVVVVLAAIPATVPMAQRELLSFLDKKCMVGLKYDARAEVVLKYDSCLRMWGIAVNSTTDLDTEIADRIRKQLLEHGRTLNHLLYDAKPGQMERLSEAGQELHQELNLIIRTIAGVIQDPA